MPQQPKEDKKSSVGRPLQRLPYADKIADKNQWFKDNADFYLRMANFHGSYNVNQQHRDLDLLYGVYNNKFPLDWFKHITDPLNAVDERHRNYPAKIRPTGMLRTNLDLLLGEYPKRPFVYQCQNMGEDGYNSYLEKMADAVRSNLQEHFLAEAQAAMKGNGMGQNMTEIPQGQGQGPDQSGSQGAPQIELPDSVKQRFTASYKDNLAIRAQKWMKRAITEYKVRQEMLRMFKDWIITGSAYSYKGLHNGNFQYRRISPKNLRFDKSENKSFVEDAEWQVHREWWTLSDVVDKFYEDLKDKDLDSLETGAGSNWNTPQAMFAWMQSSYANREGIPAGRIPVYHVCWKGKKQIKYITYTDPLTGQAQEMQVDEDVPSDPSWTVDRTIWVNEAYETWVVGENIYPVCRAIPVQRNEMNNFSSCKLPYNGRNYSDTHAENISILEMGLPFAIMDMITGFTIEKTIAKSKGKIAMIDKNTIPSKGGWNEEKFFYYAEAMGYFLIDRNQQGVDKSWNQYHVLDLTLWEQIKNLLEYRTQIRKDWDDQLGINPQRKAQIGSSDGLGTTQQALFQSSVITDMIFTLFEEFTESDLQGILDFSKFVNVDGIRAIYNQDDFDRDLLEIDPNSYASAELGIFITHSASEMQTLQKYKDNIQAMIQNGVKQSTILEVELSNNVAELMSKLKVIEQTELEQMQMAKQQEQEHEATIEGMKEQFLKVQGALKIDQINAEWDRRDENEVIKGEYALYSYGKADESGDGSLDSEHIQERIMATQDHLNQQRLQQEEINHKTKVHNDNMALERQKLDVQKKDVAVKDKVGTLQAKAALIKARQRPKSSK